jgi:PAS domain S-box-containing protein
MGWDFDAWLQTHREEVRKRWLEEAGDLSPYAALPPEERLTYWQPLLQALETGEIGVLETWASQEVGERDVVPAQLLTLVESLARAVNESLPAEAESSVVDARIGNVVLALAHHAAGEARRLATEKSQLETLHEISRELTSLDLSRGLQKTLIALMAAMGAEKGVIYLTDDAVEKISPSTGIDWHDREISVDVLPAPWQRGRTEPLVTFGDWKSEGAQAWVDRLADPDVAALIIGPLVANGQFRGILALASSKAKAFRPHHLQLLRNVLSQVATAIGNADVNRLISQQAQELGLMFRQQQEQATEREAILTSIADGVVVNDTEGSIILVNPAAEHILGVERKELLSRDYGDLFSVFDEKGQKEAIAAMRALLSTEVPEVAKDYNIKLEAEGRVIHALLSPVILMRGDFKGVVTIFRDVTKEVEADRAKSEFVSTVSHELRTPMTAIKGYTDLLHAGAAGPINPEQKRFLTTIKSNTDRLTALINDLLDISRMETGRIRFEPRPLQVGDVVADVVNALAGQAEENKQSLTYEVAAGLPDVLGDRDRLNQVLTNLVGNAVRYTPEGGDIEVQVYAVEKAVRVDVRDTGIGIDPEDMAHIFERFYRADHPLVQEKRGTGLGLSIVKMFVEMHGGRIWVESEPDQGSTFTFILPIPVREEEAETRPPVSLLTAKVRSILVVDDDRNAADIAKRQLEGSGYRVTVQAQGRAVEKWAEENHPDVIVLDLILPDVDGLDILRALKRNTITNDIPVVVRSIVPDDGTAWELGVSAYLTKPVSREDLLNAVEQALTWQGRVLIVEDDPDTVGLLEATMRQIGFTPLVAADGYEALTVARRHRPDLVLLDLRLPGMDGFEALTHLKRDSITQTIPIIAISAHVADTERERNRLLALGAAAFVPKPFAIGDLLSEIEAALQPLAGPTPT